MNGHTGVGGRIARILLLVALLPAAGVAGQSLARSPGELAQRMDSDGDGGVSLAEYQAYMSRGFRELDRNRDGVLDADELPAGTGSSRRRLISLTAHEQALAAAFHRQDVNRDGILDARELALPPQ